MRFADPGVQQAQVVVDLRDGSHCGSRVAVGRLLIDGHRRAQAFDEIDIRLVELAQELPCVRRQGFHVPALTLGENGVEREAGFAGTGQTGEHNQGIPRQLHVDVLQIVLTGTPHDQFVLHHTRLTGGCDSAFRSAGVARCLDQLAQARSIKRGPSQPSTRGFGPELMAHKPHFTRTTAVAHQTWARTRRRGPDLMASRQCTFA